MTRDTYDKATVALDRFNKLVAVRDKIKREFPEFEYDQEAKEIGNAIFVLLEARIKTAADDFGYL
jgi:hypothetical protein